MIAERRRRDTKPGLGRDEGRRTCVPLLHVTGALSVMLLVQAAICAGAGAQPSDPFAICENQRYALCATAFCLVYNEVAYCKCDIEFGSSISEPFDFGSGDICAVNQQGNANGYLMSTYSLPDSVVSGGNQALYTCPGNTSDGAYAQCDGGFCFASTRGKTFPGFDQPLANDEIICSCPITVADPSQPTIGYQMVGPYPCQEAFFENCTSTVANTNTGSTIYVGAPTGAPRILTYALYGSVPPLNRCKPSH